MIADGLVLKYTDIKARSRPSKRMLSTIKSWLERHVHAINMAESQFVQPEKEEDLMATTNRTKSPLRTFLEGMKWFRRSPPFKLNVCVRTFPFTTDINH